MRRFLNNRWIHFLLLSALIFWMSISSFSDMRWRQEIQFYVSDTFNRMYPRQIPPEDQRVIIVDIDDHALENWGQWPWPRDLIAKLVETLTAMGAKAIVFDGVLAEPDRSSPAAFKAQIPAQEQYAQLHALLDTMSDHDETLAQTIRESKVFVAGFTHASYVQNPKKPALKKPFIVNSEIKDIFLKDVQAFRTSATFLPVLEQAASGNGSFMATPDSDGVLRTTSLIFSNDGALYPSLSLEAIRIGYGSAKSSIRIVLNRDYTPNNLQSEYMIIVSGKKIPVESDALMRVYFRKFSREDDYISADEIFNFQGGEKIQNRVIFIGSSAEGLKDLRSTALEPFRPGVEVHANITEQILNDTYLQRPNIIKYAEANAILVAGMIILALISFVNIWILALITISIITTVTVGSIHAYTAYGLVLDPFFIGFSIFTFFLLSTLLTYLRTESERQQIRDAFGFYISPDYMKDLTENPSKLKLGGENRDLTVMFTDIRKFTSISEGFDPEELIRLMNDFLTPMSDLVMHNKGTIDKYIGDAMMAFWNAPLNDEDHARNACKAALGMQEALSPINRQLIERAEKAGTPPVLLQAGIGINTGICAVGNMGSKHRFAYSALGDTVNLASRLEEQTKYYGTNILLGEDTAKDVPDYATLEVDLVKVKGREEAEHIYALIGNEHLANSEIFISLKINHEQMLEHYRKSNFKKAKDALNKCKEIDIFGLDMLYDVYEERIKKMTKKPPAANWNGIHIAEAK